MPTVTKPTAGDFSIPMAHFHMAQIQITCIDSIHEKLQRGLPVNPVPPHGGRTFGRCYGCGSGGCQDLGYLSGLARTSFQGVSNGLAGCWAKDNPSCFVSGCGAWRIPDCPFTGLESGMQISTIRQASPGPRNAMPDPSDNGCLRQARCDEPGIGGVGWKGDSTDRRPTQVETSCCRRFRRNFSIPGISRRKSCGDSHLPQAIGVDRCRDAEGGGDCQGEAESKGGKKPPSKAREGRQGEGLRGQCAGPHIHGPLTWWWLLLIFFQFFVTVDAGVADDFGRPRNILPLPEIPEDGGGNQGSDSWRPFANQGIKALNELSVCTNFDFSAKRKTTRAQRRVQQMVRDAYSFAYPGSSCFADCDGLHGLCSSSRLYNTGKSAVMPYAEGNISWPQVAFSPVPLVECIPAADREWPGSWHKHMLNSEPTQHGDDIHTDVDPVLKNDKGAYSRFLHELHKRNMVKFMPADGQQGVLGIFFVQKKSGQLRLIFDTRRMNLDFKEPPKTDLPSADAFTRLETPINEEF